MKKVWISVMVFNLSTMLYAECSSAPIGMELAKSIEAGGCFKSKVFTRLF